MVINDPQPSGAAKRNCKVGLSVCLRSSSRAVCPVLRRGGIVRQRQFAGVDFLWFSTRVATPDWVSRAGRFRKPESSFFSVLAGRVYGLFDALAEWECSDPQSAEAAC